MTKRPCVQTAACDPLARLGCKIQRTEADNAEIEPVLKSERTEWLERRRSSTAISLVVVLRTMPDSSATKGLDYASYKRLLKHGHL
jgi:hypothetical protein